MATEAVRWAIENYNKLRPYGSCGYHTPKQAHQMQGELAGGDNDPNIEILRMFNKLRVHLLPKMSNKSDKLFQGDELLQKVICSIHF